MLFASVLLAVFMFPLLKSMAFKVRVSRYVSLARPQWSLYHVITD